MVRGNWQKRVERTEARRVANKLQKEQRRAKRSSSSHDDKAQRTTSYRLLSEWLDDTDFFPPDPGDVSEEGSGQYSLIVDVWTDARPKNRHEYAASTHDVYSDDDDFEEDDGRGGKGKSKTKNKDRGGFKKPKGKKAHPNTKRQTEEEDVVRIRRESRSNSMSVKDDEKLCAKEFFFGKEKCTAGKFVQQRQKGSKRGNNDLANAGCNLRHYHQFAKVNSNMGQSPPLTLAQVVNGKYQPLLNNSDSNKYPVSLPLKVREATLQYAYNAMIGTDDDIDALDTSSEANTSIDSIYHTRIYVSDNTKRVQSDNEHDQRSSVLDALQQLLDREKLSQTSLIYLTIQGVLVYDLNRGGMVFSEAEEDFLISGEDIDVDAFLQYNAVDALQPTGPSHIHEELTHHVLEYILSYLPDEAAAVLPQVCKSWRDEVGTKSPQLWKLLLNRHNWPFRVGIQACDLDAYRDAFISHYVAARDIRAIASASSLLTGSSINSNAVDKSGIDYAIQRYKSTTGAPQFTDSNCCAKVRVWSENVYAEKNCSRALAVFSHDFTLRLFEVVPRNNVSGTQTSSRSTKCRQIACVRAIPPSVSQRKTAYWLGGMDLDEDVVATLFCCASENDRRLPPDASAAFLSIISRDDLACAGNEGLMDNDSLREFDVRAMILDFLLCGADHIDHLQAALHDYLSIWDGDTSHIAIIFSQNLVSCGHGYFLCDAFITIPVESDVESDDSDNDRSSVGPHSGVGHRIFLLSIKKGRGKIVKAIQVGVQGGNHIELHASNPSLQQYGTINGASVRKLCTNVVVKSTGISQDLSNLSIQIFKDGTVDMQMKAIIESPQIQSVDVAKILVVVTSNCVVSARKSSIGTFLEFVCDGENEMTHDKVLYTIEVGESSSKMLCGIFCIRDEYVAVILETRQDREEEEDAVAGEWFGLDEDPTIKREVVLFHISSRREIFRYPLPTHLIRLDCIGDTIAANVSNLGFFIAGGNAREVARTSPNDESEISPTPTKTTKAKKKRLASLASGRKKDGFARGMSMRG